MSALARAEAVVLRKTDYSDSSKIATLYTKDFGKISVIVKGGRRGDSKIGRVVDPLNHIEAVLYNKDSRDVQLLSQAELIAHFKNIRTDYQSTMYAFAVLEMVLKLTPEHDANPRLFAAVTRILTRMDAIDANAVEEFCRFFVFFLTVMGFELQLSSCSSCGNALTAYVGAAFDYSRGIVCSACTAESGIQPQRNLELFNALRCLKYGNEVGSYADFKEIIRFLEIYLSTHFPEYNGLSSLRTVM